MDISRSAARKPSLSLPPTMKVVSSPPNEKALTNKAYCSINNAAHFLPGPGLDEGMVYIKKQIVLTVSPDSDGCLALNSIHRKVVRVSLNDDVEVAMGLQIDAERLKLKFTKQYGGQVMSLGQSVSFDYNGSNYIFTVKDLTAGDQTKKSILEGKQALESNLGLWTKDTHVILETLGNSGITITNQKGGGRNLFKTKDFNFQKLGIRGLDNEFEDIFRRAFASRIFPPHVINKLGIKHVKGMLLWGPPGTGKTLIARQIGKMLNGKEPKIVNGPEVLSKFVGETEKNVRQLFADAENDLKNLGRCDVLACQLRFRNLDVLSPREVEKAVNVVAGEMPIKKLLMLIEMSKQGGSDQGALEKIDLGRFEACYQDLAQ